MIGCLAADVGVSVPSIGHALWQGAGHARSLSKKEPGTCANRYPGPDFVVRLATALSVMSNTPKPGPIHIPQHPKRQE